MVALIGRRGDAGTDVTDAEIIRLSAADPERFAQIFDRYYTEVHGYVTRRLGPGLADDVAAETFLVAFDQRDRYDPAYPVARPWLYGITANLVARHRRAEIRLYRALARVGPAPAVDGQADADRIAGRVDAEACRSRLAAGLATLAPADRDVLLLVAWAGLSGEEAARALGIPAGTARSRLHRARKKIRDALGGADGNIRGEDTP